jgi:acylphosphatase
MIKHFDITVTGNVQGVFFRKYTIEKAQELGLKGTVRNMPDGSVFIEAEGEENALAQFAGWCYEGSPYSKVEEVVVKEGEVKRLGEFSMRR